MTKQFVFDTNSVISAHLLKHSTSRKAYDVAFEKGMVLRSEETLDELALTFIRSKFDKYISLEKRIAAISEFEQRSFFISVKNAVKICRDEKDDKFLSLALAARADFIITGDSDLLILHPFHSIAILTPSGFLKMML